MSLGKAQITPSGIPPIVGWDSLGRSFSSEPAAVAWGPNRLDVFGQGSDTAIWWRYWDGSSWSSAWNSLGGSFASPPTVVSWGSGRLDVFAVATDTSLQHKAFDNGA